MPASGVLAGIVFFGVSALAERLLGHGGACRGLDRLPQVPTL